jgi:hypothetical protein
MFSCRKCKSELKDTDRYCYGCGAYIGEPAVKSDEWQEPEDNEEDQIQYEYNEEGKIIRLHCEECDAIVEKYHKYCSNCGKLLENNTRIELVEPKTLDESSVDSEGEDSGFIGKIEKKITYLLKKFFSNKKLVAAVSLVIVFAAAGGYFYKQFNKPVVRYEQDPSYKTFVKDKEFTYYSYFYDAQVKGLQEKRGVYKMKADGSNMVKISDRPVAFMNIYKDYIYYINFDDRKVYRMKKDGSDNKKISDNEAASLVVDRGYIYYRDKGAAEESSTLFRMKIDGTKKKEISKDALTYNVFGDYIYYSSRSSIGDVYRIKTDGSDKTKMCKINGALKYIKDDYIYYSMVNENIKDPVQYLYNIGYINKVKLDGTNPTKLSSKEVSGFLLDNNNIYYEQNDQEKNDGTINLYKADPNGNSDTKVAEKISPFFYVANDQVYYIDNETALPYRKDFKGSDKISLLGIDDKSAENYKIEIIKTQRRSADEIESLPKNIENMRVVVINQKSDNKVFEVYNTRVLDGDVQWFQSGRRIYLELSRFIKDGSNINLDEFVQMQYDGEKIMYVSFKKDSTDYKVDKALFFESLTKKEQGNTVKYYLIEKKGDPEDKWTEILSINKDAIKS